MTRTAARDGRHRVNVPVSGAGIWVYGATLLVCAALTFLLEPLFGRMVLPLLGGTPEVWNTCVVCYQVLLLAGYAYAHLVSRWLSRAVQVVLHVGLMCAALAVVPIRPAVGWLPPPEGAAVARLIVLLLVSIGPPFFVLAATAPLLQHWFAALRHRDGTDPYHLYALSNLGSFAGLLAYPTLVEPSLRLATQARLWTAGYVTVIALVAAAGWMALRVGERTAPVRPAREARADGLADTTIGQRTQWVLLAALPASLMLSATTYASTDIAAVPLLWVVPLALYLLTFVLAFSRSGARPAGLAAAAVPVLALVAGYLLTTERAQPVAFILPLHLATLTAAALACHARLAASRPEPSRLTGFYLYVAVGGVVGGLFNLLAAPLLFVKPTEYPLMLAAACVAAAPPMRHAWRRVTLGEWALIFLPSVALVGLVASVRVAQISFRSVPIQVLAIGVPFLLAAGLWRQPRRLGVALAGLFLAGGLVVSPGERVLLAERDFYGMRRVIDNGTTHVLLNGTTTHGAQPNDPGRRREPLTYYGRSGPVGDVFDRLRSAAEPAHVGVIGLGAGSLSAYARPGERWTFYELNPAVERVARDPRLFNLLSLTPDARVVLGDARLSLARSAETYDILAVDAFSSDAIPVHLITREAVQLYVQHLRPHGAVVFHISNRYLNLGPVLADIAAADRWYALGREHLSLTDQEARGGLSASVWVILARSADDLAPLAATGRWGTLERGAAAAAWTDDFSNIWSVLQSGRS